MTNTCKKLIRQGMVFRRNGKGGYQYLSNHITRKEHPMLYTVVDNCIRELNAADLFRIKDKNFSLYEVTIQKAEMVYYQFKGRCFRRLEQLRYKNKGWTYRKPVRPLRTYEDGAKLNLVTTRKIEFGRRIKNKQEDIKKYTFDCGTKLTGKKLSDDEYVAYFPMDDYVHEVKIKFAGFTGVSLTNR